MPYQAGIIGTGGVAGLGTIGVHEESTQSRASHAGGYKAVDGIELVAAADVDRENLDRFCDAWGIPEGGRYDDHTAMLADQDLDAVSVCSPAIFHQDHVLNAAAAGVDVILCEKPIASSLAEGREMIEACERAGTDLVVNYTLRFTEKFQRLREHVLDGDALGEMYSVAVQSRMEFVRNGSHVLDLLTFLLDERIEWISGVVHEENESVDSLAATSDVDDAAGAAMVQLEDGTLATIDCTIPRVPSAITYRFAGSRGTLVIGLDEGVWDYRQLVDGDHVPAEMPGVDEPWTWDRDYEQGFENAVAHILSRLDGSDRTISTGKDALQSLEGIVGLYLSHYTDSRVSLPLDRPLSGVEVRSW